MCVSNNSQKKLCKIENLLTIRIPTLSNYNSVICVRGADHRHGNSGDESGYWESVGPVWEEVSAHTPNDTLHYPTRYFRFLISIPFA